MPKIIVLVGPPGIGKSTYIKNNIPEDYVILSSDDIIEEEAEKLSLTYNEAFKIIEEKYVNKILMDRFKQAYKNGQNIVVDRTNVTKKSRRKFTNMCGKHYEKEMVVFEFTKEILMERTKERENNTGKRISENVIDFFLNCYQEPSLEEEEFDRIINIPLI